MNPIAKLGAAVAAVLVIGVVAWNLLPGPIGPGGPNPTPSPSPTQAQPSPTPEPTGPIALPDGPLTGGTYVIEPSPLNPTLSLVADIPSGWRGHPANGALTKDFGSDLGVFIGFMTVDGLFSDPCHWDVDGSGAEDQPGDVVVYTRGRTRTE